MKKFNVKKCSWKHHLSTGGWNWVNDLIYKNFNYQNAEIDFYTAYESQIRDSYITKPCVAFFHQVVTGYIRSLENIVSAKNWEHNRKMILGAFTLSHRQADFLRNKGIKNVFCMLHPTPLNVKKWNYSNFLKSKKIIHVGVHCRNLDFFCDLSKSKTSEFDFVYIATKNEVPDIILINNVLYSKRLSSFQYNEILTKSIVFLQLTAATANNTVLECIARGTPLIVNRLDEVVEYLGENYPLYYRNYDEAIDLINEIANNSEILLYTQNYLNKIAYKFNQDKFIELLKNNIEKYVS